MSSEPEVESQTLSSEQPEVKRQTLPSVADITPQVTTPTPTPRQKNPKRQAAGKRTAEKTRIAREQQKKALAEAEEIIAKNNMKSSPHKPDTPAGLTVNQWIGIGGLVVSAAGLFLKRGEIMTAVKKNLSSPPPPPPPPPPVEPERQTVLRKVP